MNKPMQLTANMAFCDQCANIEDSADSELCVGCSFLVRMNRDIAVRLGHRPRDPFSDKVWASPSAPKVY